MAQRCIDVYNKMPEKVRKSLDVYKTIYSVAKEHEQYLTAKENRFRASAY
jgi:hypothetical protein